MFFIASYPDSSNKRFLIAPIPVGDLALNGKLKGDSKLKRNPPGTLRFNALYFTVVIPLVLINPQ